MVRLSVLAGCAEGNAAPHWARDPKGNLGQDSPVRRRRTHVRSTPAFLMNLLRCHGFLLPTTALSMRNKLREQKAWNSLNQLISLCDEERRHFETKRFGGLEIDHQLELRRLLDG